MVTDNGNILQGKRVFFN